MSCQPGGREGVQAGQRHVRGRDRRLCRAVLHRRLADGRHEGVLLLRDHLRFAGRAILTFTGASTIRQTLGGAELYGADTGWINFANRTFETTVNIVGGTKQYDGASGQLVATGNLTPTGTIGTYTGEICKHHD